MMSKTKRSKVFHSNFYAMGTRMDVVIPSIDSEEGDEIFQAIRMEVLRLHKKLSRFDESSIIWFINEHAYNNDIPVDNEIFNIVSDCKEKYLKTHGYFDITQRKLMEYWKQEDRNPDVLHQLKELLGMDKVVLDDEARTIRFENDKIEIDMGGYGKGYAMENIRGILAEYSVNSAFISFGESSVLTVGKHPHGDYWCVGIRNLYNGSENAHVFSIINQSVSTSGITPLQKDSEWGHIIDPLTGIPVKGSKTVSVSANSALDAEVLSTALLVADKSTQLKIIDGFNTSEIVEITYTNSKSYQVNKIKAKI